MAALVVGGMLAGLTPAMADDLSSARATPDAVSAAGEFVVDSRHAACSNSGPGTPDAPYCSITAAVAANRGPGVTILVKPGVYREQVSIPASGAEGSPFVIRALGSANDPVVIDGSDDFSDPALWSRASGNVWLAQSVNWSPKQVFADDQRLVASSGPPDALPARSFTYVEGSGLYVNLGGDSPASHRALVGRRNLGFSASAKSWVEIQGFTVVRTEDKGISFGSGSSQSRVSENRVTLCTKAGIQLTGCTGIVVARNATFENGSHGIALTNATTACTIEDNETYRNADPAVRVAAGIYMFAATGNRLQRNRIHHNQDTGVDIKAGSNDNLLLLNRSWSNGDHGFDHLNSTGNEHIGSVSFGNHNDGISIEGNSTGHRLHDCISVDNGLETEGHDLWVDETSTAGFTSDDNLFWNSNGQAPIGYRSTRYGDMGQYSAASGQDTRTFQADPRFADPKNGDFRLAPGSPAIDAANTDLPNWPARDAAGNERMDDPSVANSGRGPVTFADRGALEFRPTASNQAPVARVSVSPSSGTEPLTVTADASASSDADGTIASYRFDFGDGTVVGPQAGARAQHSYRAGNWTVRVTVTDNAGATATASATVTVSGTTNQAPVARVSVSPSSGTEPLTVTADASASSDADGTIASYRFDFGDGTAVGPQAGARAQHTYRAGSWTVRVTVTDNAGATATASATVTVNRANQPPVAQLSVTPSSGIAPLPVVASGLGSSDPDGKVVSYKFDFGDGTVVGPLLLATQAHIYRAGTWTCRLTVTDDRGATASASVEVRAASLLGPLAALSEADSGSVRGPAIDFAALSSPRMFPNPIAGAGRLMFGTTRAGPVSIRILELSGRQVRGLLDEPWAPAGPLVATFDGRGDDGSRLRPGIYFFQVRTIDGAKTGRFTVVR